MEDKTCNHPFCQRAKRQGTEKIDGKWWCWVCAGAHRIMEHQRTAPPGIYDAKQFYNRPAGPEGEVAD